jgi:CRP-like cAMP-binding protein
MADKSKLDRLRAVSLFAGMRARDLEAVERLADTVDLPAGHVLMRQGEVGNEMFVIEAGSVKVERDGRELGRRGPGGVLGEISLLSEGPRTATVTTLEPTTAFVIGHREFHTLMADSSELRDCILDSVASKIRALDAAAH